MCSSACLLRDYWYRARVCCLSSLKCVRVLEMERNTVQPIQSHDIKSLPTIVVPSALFDSRRYLTIILCCQHCSRSIHLWMIVRMVAMHAALQPPMRSPLSTTRLWKTAAVSCWRDLHPPGCGGGACAAVVGAAYRRP